MKNQTNFSSAEKIHHLKILEEALERKLNKITFLKDRNAQNFKKCNLGIVVQKSKGRNAFETVYEYVETRENVKFKRIGKSGPVDNATGHKFFNNMREQLFEHRLTNAASEQDGLTKIDEAGDAEMELASDEEGG